MKGHRNDSVIQVKFIYSVNVKHYEAQQNKAVSVENGIHWKLWKKSLNRLKNFLKLEKFLIRNWTEHEI